MARKAKQQWSDPERRASINSALREAGLRRRRRYEDLTEDSFTQTKTDGRKFASYWSQDEETRYIYRYRWRWEQANGTIPSGYAVHHRDEDPTNDDLSNLKLLSTTEHRHYHGLRLHAEAGLRRIEYRCGTCGRSFWARERTGRQQRYCSADCYRRRRNSMT
jgi:hypothetical protein